MQDVLEVGIDDLRPGRYQPRLQLREDVVAFELLHAQAMAEQLQRALREALQAAARGPLRLCRLSKPAQAGSEPQASAPRGLISLNNLTYLP